jgi:hypothetical protein
MSSKYNLRIWKDSVVVHFNVLERLNKIKKNLLQEPPSLICSLQWSVFNFCVDITFLPINYM